MASTSRRHTTSYATRAFLLLLAMSSTATAADFGTSTPKGCFKASSQLKSIGTYLYQTSGYCQKHCAADNKPVFGLAGGNECLCGDQLPATDLRVDDNNCNDPCDGYDQDMCGGDGYWNVFLTGLDEDVSTGNAPPTTKAAPSTITSVVAGQTTIVVTKAAQTSSSAASDSNSDGGGTNSTAIAAGVVVAIVVVSGVLAGLFFWLRHRRRQAAEDDFKRTQIADFMRSGELKPPQTGYSSMSDSRLEPAEFGNKRNSHGSIADNEDFSRKILRVANPDRS